MPESVLPTPALPETVRPRPGTPGARSGMPGPAVRMTLDEHGLPTRIEIRTCDRGPLAPLVLDAYRAAVVATAAQPWPGSAPPDVGPAPGPLSAPDSDRPSQTGLDAAGGRSPADPELPRRLGELVAEAVRLGSAPPARVTGHDTGRRVALTFAGTTLVACTVDGRWATDPARVTAAFTEALADARTRLASLRAGPAHLHADAMALLHHLAADTAGVPA